MKLNENTKGVLLILTIIFLIGSAINFTSGIRQKMLINKLEQTLEINEEGMKKYSEKRNKNKDKKKKEEKEDKKENNKKRK